MNGVKETQLAEELEVIHSYSRADAINDGVLIDVSDVAAEAGLKYPTALTSAVWLRYVEVPRGVIGQDEKGRLWDILWMTRYAAQMAPAKCDTVKVILSVRNNNRGAERVELKAICSPGDTPEPVVTIMLPNED